MVRRSTPSPSPRTDPFFTLSFDPLCITTLNGDFTNVNPAFTAALGHTQPDLLSKNLLDLLHPEDRPPAASQFAKLRQGKPAAALQSRFVCADGTFKSVTWQSAPALAEGLAYTVLHDQTSQNQAAEARCERTLERTTDAFFLVDRDGRLMLVNQQAERLWMRKREELLGRILWDLFPEAVGGAFYKLYEQVIHTGAPAHLEEYYPHPPLNRWFQVHVYPSPEGVAVYFRDVTDRRQAEEKIRRSVQEKEVLLREVHHRVKNNLQIICSMLRLQSRYLADESLLQILRDCRERVLAMAMLHDQLHRAKDLSHINLGEYIRNLAASLFCSYGVNSADIGLHVNVEDITVAIDMAIPCGLIVNELISNSLRHAFPNGTGNVSLGLHAPAAGTAELIVCDDGRGFPDGAPANRSLGLWLVELLAGQIDALVERSCKSGTSYRIAFEVSETGETESHV